MPLSQYTLSFSSIYLSYNQFHFISHVFEHFGFIPELTNLNLVELSVLSVVSGCLQSKAIRASRIPIAVLPLLNVPHVSASVYEDTSL